MPSDIQPGRLVRGKEAVGLLPADRNIGWETEHLAPAPGSVAGMTLYESFLFRELQISRVKWKG